LSVSRTRQDDKDLDAAITAFRHPVIAPRDFADRFHAASTQMKAIDIDIPDHRIIAALPVSV
jgi:hypothetical protein